MRRPNRSILLIGIALATLALTVVLGLPALTANAFQVSPQPTPTETFTPTTEEPTLTPTPLPPTVTPTPLPPTVTPTPLPPTPTLAPMPPAMAVPVDIKPGACPNPINTRSKGVTQVALLGTEGFDIVQIDPLTVVLFNAELAQPEEASPLRWAQEGVAAPYEPYVGKPAEVDACTAASPDGYLDLELKFDTQELVAAMGEVIDGQAVKLSVTGNLRAEFGGSPFMGEDVVKVLDKGKKPQKQLLR